MVNAFASSVMIDNFGNSYKASGGQIANESNITGVIKLLVSDVPTRARLTFDEVSPQATRIALLTTQFRADKIPGDPSVRFRNVPLVR
jgi:hypothetical protein